MGHAGSHANAGGQLAVAFDVLAGGETAPAAGDVAGALHGGGKSGGRAAVAFAQNQRDEVRLMEVAGAIAAEPGMKQQTYLAQGYEVRRLTPRECERLQGFPDDFTRIPWGARKRIEAAELLYLRLTNPTLTMDEARRLAADGPRYKALGNSSAVNCAEWIGERIAVVDGLGQNC
jgi:DNA (cytosine-5)-methyltransferase 1